MLRNVSLSSLTSYDSGLAGPNHMAPNYMHLLASGQCLNFNGWFAFTNAWGVGSMVAGRDYQLTGSFNSHDMTAGTSFNWSFAVKTALSPPILAYPEVVFGFSPLNTTWNPGIDPAAVFPLKIADMISVTSDYKVSYGGNLAGFDVAYDIWFSKSATATGWSNVSNEVMVWLHKGDVQPFGTLVGQFSSNGVNFSIYHSGTYTALVADRDVPAGTVDITGIINKLVSLNIMSNTEYLRSVELGAEVVSGSGWLSIDDLQITAESKSGSGGIITKVTDGAHTVTTQSNVLSAADVVLRDVAEAGTSSRVDQRGVVVGSKSVVIDGDGAATVALANLAHYTTGVNVVRHDDVSVTTEHYTAGGVFTGVDRGSYTASGAVLIEHYDAGIAFVGADQITVSDNVVTTDNFAADWSHIATERTVTTGTTVVTEHYDAAYEFTGVDKSDLNGPTTLIQHFDSSYDLTSADLVTVKGARTVTKHFDGDWQLTGGEAAQESKTGVVRTTSYDATWHQTETSLTGTDGADKLHGSAGTTHFHGGAGADLLRGGAGADFFHLTTPADPGSAATIKAFDVALDHVVLDHDLFADGAGPGTLDPSAFALAGAATDASRVIYDAASGDLVFDANGSGAGASVLLAHLGTGLHLTADNILLG